jgi:hypothetical protein
VQTITTTDVDRQAHAPHTLSLDVPAGAESGDLRLTGLAIAHIAGLEEDRADPDNVHLDPIPIYVRLRRALHRRGLLDLDTVPMWPAADW